MLKGKILIFLTLLLGIFVAITSHKSTASPTKEGFWGGIPNRTVKVVQSITNPRTGAQMALAPNSFIGNLPDSQFIKTPSFQANLAPRFSNVSYGAHIKYNMPDYQNQAVPCNPLTYGKMASENYASQHAPTQQMAENYTTSCGSGSCSDGGCSVSCGKGGASVPYTGGDQAVEPGYASGNYNDMLNKEYGGDDVVDSPQNALPLGSMNSVDADGNVGQDYVYQNYIYANQRSRLRGLGDQIRGDISVSNSLQPGWFYPSAAASPNVNLNTGALNVIAGANNEQGQSISNAVFQASGGAVTALGGIDMSRVSGTPEYRGNLSAIYNDITVSAMP
jgi:hypothetical protein